VQSNADDKQARHAERLIILAARASVAVAFTLLLFKLWAWFATGSMGILAALVDSLLDLGASLINMFAVRYAMVPPDDEHRFGHGKAEALAGLGQSAFIASSALFLIIYTVERIVHPEMIESVDIGSGVIILSMAVTFILVVYQRYVVRVTGSVAIRADSLHYASDLITNGGILVGLVLYNAGWLYSDPVIAMLIGIYILKCAVDIGHESIQLLLDRELPEEEQEIIRKLAIAHPEVIGVHDVRTRQSGRTKFIQLHLVLNGQLSLSEAHDLSDIVEAEINAAFDDVDIIIHQDPHTECDSRVRYPE
jgi:ferrous-iron efflux pump FieF